MTKNLCIFPFKYCITFLFTLSLILGILYKELDYNLMGPIVISILSIFLLVYLSKNPLQKIKYIILATAIFYLGGMRHKQQHENYKLFFDKINNKTLDITTTINDIKPIEGKRYNFSILGKIKQAKNSTNKLKMKMGDKNLKIYTKTKPKINIGDTIIIKNLKLKAPKNNSFIKHLMKENIAITLFANKLDYEVIRKPKYSVQKWIFTKRNQLFCNIKSKMPPITFGIFSSIFLGSKNIGKKSLEKLKLRFKNWGILHFLARSGLHLIIFLLLCEFILKYIPLYFVAKQLILITIGIIYLFLSWPSLSFIRAFGAFLFYKISPILNRKPDLPYIIMLICFAMLLYNPIYLFFLDFQLSFGLTFALSFFNQARAQKRTEHTLSHKNNQISAQQNYQI